MIGWWWAAVIGAGISFVLFLSLPLWVPQEGMTEGDSIHDIPLPDAENAGESGFAKLVSGRPVMWGLTLLAVLAGGWLRMQIGWITACGMTRSMRCVASAHGGY